MHGKFLYLFVLVCLTRHARSRDVESCHADDNDPYFYTGIKTPYNYVYNETAQRINLPGEYPDPSGNHVFALNLLYSKQKIVQQEY